MSPESMREPSRFANETKGMLDNDAMFDKDAMRHLDRLGMRTQLSSFVTVLKPTCQREFMNKTGNIISNT